MVTSQFMQFVERVVYYNKFFEIWKRKNVDKGTSKFEAYYLFEFYTYANIADFAKLY